MPYIGSGVSQFNTADSLTVSGTSTLSGNVSIPDSTQLIFGDGSDFKISHNGSKTKLEDTGTGNLEIRGTNIEFYSGDGGETLAKLTDDGAAELYHNNTKRIETTSTGVHVTGGLNTTSSVNIGGTGAQAKFEVNSAVSTTGSLTDTTINLATTGVTGRKANIGFGLAGGVANTNAAAIGFDVTDGSGALKGDLFFSTRGSTSDSTPTERLRILAGGGLTFNGDTAANNALNDYETGTWTPTFLASGTNPTINSVGNGTGYYVKVGDIVHFAYYSSAMNIGSAGIGVAYVGNLPFTSSNGSNEYWLFQYIHGTAIGGSTTGGYINQNQNAISFIQPNSTSGIAWTAGNPQYMMISGSYRAA